jgi:nucleoside-diphosphate-sugar epimerase
VNDKKKVVILGASGFVGTTLTERLQKRSKTDVVPVIHRAGSAWRLARKGPSLVQADVSDASRLLDVLRGTTHVVNCTRGPRAVMIDGLRNILKACHVAGVRRFVHLSSVMVYGDPPHPASWQEDAPAIPPTGSDNYGMLKLEQDKLVQAAAAGGLSSVILCPPNISGPFSDYIAGIVGALRGHSFAVLDEGGNPCNLVDVRNLCHAIELSLDADVGALQGDRIFVTDAENVTWKDVIAELVELTEQEHVRRIPRSELLQFIDRGSSKRPLSLAASLRHLVSSDVRAELRKDPLLGKLDLAARTTIKKLGRDFETRLRLGIEGPIPVAKPNPYAGLALGLCAQQLRDVRHLTKRAEQILQYKPVVTFKQSMVDFRAWYRKMHGMDTPFWAISRHLYG